MRRGARYANAAPSTHDLNAAADDPGPTGFQFETFRHKITRAGG